jgi:hypothetical protein
MVAIGGGVSAILRQLLCRSAMCIGALCDPTDKYHVGLDILSTSRALTGTVYPFANDPDVTKGGYTYPTLHSNIHSTYYPTMWAHGKCIPELRPR